MHGNSHQHQRKHRRHQPQPAGIEPSPGRRRQLQMQVGRGERIGQQARHTDKQHVESELQARHADLRLIDHHYIYGIGQRRDHHQCNAHHTERCTLASPVQHADADKCQQYGRNGSHGHSFPEEHGHDDGNHHGINKQNGRSNTGIHKAEALIVGDA